MRLCPAFAALLLLISPGARAEPTPGKLVVLVIVDQLGAVYLTRTSPLLKGGLHRLQQEAAYFPTMRFDYANTETAPGHATISTGAWPNVHGMVANYWFDPITGSKVNCVDDPKFGRSPAHLRVSTVGDVLALTSAGRSKVVSVALKDRAAILPAGHSGRVAWFDKKRGVFEFGRWLDHPTPSWLTNFNALERPKKSFGTTWNRSRKDVDYERWAGPDDDPKETRLPGFGTVFPKKLGAGQDKAGPEYFEGYVSTPDSSATLLALAEQAIAGEQLGRRGVADLLVIGISTLDYAGHYYGPRSQEALDVLLEIDRQLGRFMSDVERTVGKGVVTWVVTADHGIADMPEQSRAVGVRADRIDPGAVAALVDQALAKIDGGSLPAAKSIDVNPPRIHLSYRDERVDRVRARRVAAEALRRSGLFLDAVAFEDLASLQEPMATLFLRSNARGREADVYFLQRPYDVVDWVGPSGHGFGSAHSTPYTYDSAVPVFVMGEGIQRGVDRQPYPMTRVAPTLAWLLGVDPPPAAYDGPLPVVAKRLQSD